MIYSIRSFKKLNLNQNEAFVKYKSQRILFRFVFADTQQKHEKPTIC